MSIPRVYIFFQSIQVLVSKITLMFCTAFIQSNKFRKFEGKIGQIAGQNQYICVLFTLFIIIYHSGTPGHFRHMKAFFYVA